MKGSMIIVSLFATILLEVSSLKQKPLDSLFRTDNVLKTSFLEKRGWKLVFRAASGNGDSAYAAWINGTNTTTDKPISMKRTLGSHYRSPKVDNWSKLNIKYVKYAFYDEDKEAAYVIFDGRNSNLTSWFDKKNVLASSWPDLTSNQSYNYFSIEGHNKNNLQDRRFFINTYYYGCPKDLGYMVVINSLTPAYCLWDQHASYPQFLYSKLTSVDFWNRRMFGTADFMTIFINRNTF